MFYVPFHINYVTSRWWKDEEITRPKSDCEHAHLCNLIWNDFLFTDIFYNIYWFSKWTTQSQISLHICECTGWSEPVLPANDIWAPFLHCPYWHVHPAKNSGQLAYCSSLICLYCLPVELFKSFAIHREPNKDWSDVQVNRLIWVFAGNVCHKVHFFRVMLTDVWC